MNPKSFFPEEIKKVDSIKSDSITRFYEEKYGKASLFPFLLIDLFKELTQDTVKTRDTNSAKEIEKVSLRIDSLSIDAKERIKPSEFSSGKLADDFKKRENKFDQLQVNEMNLDTLSWAHLDKYLEGSGIKAKTVNKNALGDARNVKVNLASTRNRIYKLKRDVNLFTMEKERKFALAVACVLMFMIGAPLGAIIKKGGLGVPVIIAIFFFITYYIIGSIGNQQSKEGQLDPYIAVWMSDAVLVPFGLFFLRQARIDARLFEVDSYLVWVEKLKTRFAKNSK